jgi:hypothetical protein
MKSIKNAVYLDVCALCRPYDDQRYMRIAIETTAMKSAKFLDDKKVIERGVMALHKELGPIEASRFIAITGVKHQDSVGGIENGRKV